MAVLNLIEKTGEETDLRSEEDIGLECAFLIEVSEIAKSFDRQPNAEGDDRVGVRGGLKWWPGSVRHPNVIESVFSSTAKDGNDSKAPIALARLGL